MYVFPCSRSNFTQCIIIIITIILQLKCTNVWTMAPCLLLGGALIPFHFYGVPGMMASEYSVCGGTLSVFLEYRSIAEIP